MYHLCINSLYEYISINITSSLDFIFFYSYITNLKISLEGISRQTHLES